MSLQAMFGGMTAAQATGTWTIRITDSGGSDVGSVTPATLTLYVTPPPPFLDGFERG